MKNQGRSVGKLYRGEDGVWRTANDIRRKVAVALREERERYLNEHPAEALAQAQVAIVRLLSRKSR